MDFGPKGKVEEGAVVKLGGRLFVIAVSTGKFMCDDNEIVGISTQAAIYAELEGKHAGDVQRKGARDREGRLTAATPMVESSAPAQRTATVPNLVGCLGRKRMTYGTARAIFPSLPLPLPRDTVVWACSRVCQRLHGEHGRIALRLFEAEFTDQGDRCSFEAPLGHTGLTDPAVQTIAEIVHDIDLKDSKFRAG